MTNLIALSTAKLNNVQNLQKKEDNSVVKTSSGIQNNTNLVMAYLKNQAMINIPSVKNVDVKKDGTYKNDFRSMFQNNQVKMLAIIPRTFTAKDENGNEYIDGNEKSGTLLSAISRLDEVKSQGFNALHLLPIHPTGKQQALGTAGSVYSPADLLDIDPNIIDKNDSRTPKEQLKAFTDACHERGIKVMIDLPSCASVDLYNRRPDLMAKEADGNAKTPQGWNDIRMFQPWKDESKRELNPALLDLHKKYVDMCVETGIDGIRSDVARAKPPEFWDIIIPYSHKKDAEFAWLAESYTYEDASSQINMPYDRPEDSLKSGFDSYYGQYHIFHEWHNARQFMDYVEENLRMSQGLEKGKSLIGSFATHDDVSPMEHGGALYCNLTSGLQATLPMTNPYEVDGFQSGDEYVYPYEDKIVDKSQSETDNAKMDVHRGKLDIFNKSRKPGGKNPEIGDYMTKAFEMRDKYSDVVTKGSFIDLEKSDDQKDQVIAYARHFNGKTLLVVANKNINERTSVKIKVPGLSEKQELNNLLPSYGEHSAFQIEKSKLKAELAPGRIYVFEINTPSIENQIDKSKIFYQNLNR